MSISKLVHTFHPLPGMLISLLIVWKTFVLLNSAQLQLPEEAFHQVGMQWEVVIPVCSQEPCTPLGFSVCYTVTDFYILPFLPRLRTTLRAAVGLNRALGSKSLIAMNSGSITPIKLVFQFSVPHFLMSEVEIWPSCHRTAMDINTG